MRVGEHPSIQRGESTPVERQTVTATSRQPSRPTLQTQNGPKLQLGKPASARPCGRAARELERKRPMHACNCRLSEFTLTATVDSDRWVLGCRPSGAMGQTCESTQRGLSGQGGEGRRWRAMAFFWGCSGEHPSITSSIALWACSALRRIAAQLGCGLRAGHCDRRQHRDCLGLNVQPEHAPRPAAALGS